MIRRIWPFMAGLLAFGLILGERRSRRGVQRGEQVPLQLSRLDPVKCKQPIRIRAKLTDKRATRYSDAYHLRVQEVEDGRSLSPTTVITDSQGRAITIVGPGLQRWQRVIKATGPNKAKDEITLKLKKHHDDDDDDDDNDDDHDHHHHDDHDEHHESKTAGGFVANIGSGGGGSASVVTTSRVGGEDEPRELDDRIVSSAGVAANRAGPLRPRDPAGIPSATAADLARTRN